MEQAWRSTVLAAAVELAGRTDALLAIERVRAVENEAAADALDGLDVIRQRCDVGVDQTPARQLGQKQDLGMQALLAAALACLDEGGVDPVLQR
ncbi:MAG: hypothetical protein HS108_01470 [Planctomycetes bacterium]|nr:hypothetical protein [Planctomycetota bacterium]